jgi:hypothetical protein
MLSDLLKPTTYACFTLTMVLVGEATRQTNQFQKPRSNSFSQLGDVPHVIAQHSLHTDVSIFQTWIPTPTSVPFFIWLIGRAWQK